MCWKVVFPAEANDDTSERQIYEQLGHVCVADAARVTRKVKEEQSRWLLLSQDDERLPKANVSEPPQGLPQVSYK